MLKLLLSLYFTCYFCYIFYTRVPDYFDGETVIATIKINQHTNQATAHYYIASNQYSFNANYPFRKLQDGEKVEVIYNPSKPETASLYSFWGYWFTWGELLMSSILLFALFQLAVSITNNPSENLVNESNDIADIPKRKYED
jgi:hypothetical protein